MDHGTLSILRERNPAWRLLASSHAPLIASFSEIGKRMLLSWQECLAGLRNKRSYAMVDTELGEAFAGFSDPIPVKGERTVIGRSELLGKR